jgi:CHAT domain-containing protein
MSFSRKKLMLATALLLPALLVGVFWNRIQAAHVEYLLGRAYAERRTMELRISGAGYAPVAVTRGQSSHTDLPQPLIDAESKIQKVLKSHPRDPLWLQYEARAKLLEGRYADAMASLSLALESQPEPRYLFTDLATAYFQRAEVNQRAIDYGTAIDLESRVLVSMPDDPITLFNRSLSFERIFLYRQAATDLEHFLRINPRDAWAQEATERLRTIRDKLSAHQEFKDELLRDPNTFAKQAAQEGSAAFLNLSEHADDYLDIATIEWLMKALDPSIPTVKKQEARAALGLLARFLESRYDNWLTDLLADTEKPGMFKAVQSLTKAVSAARSSDYDSAVEEAVRAEGFFRTSGSVAGTLRARFERVNALDRQAKGSLCRQEAAPLTAGLKGGRYLWLEIQALSEEATCRSITGDIDTASKESDKAVELANGSGYRSIYLRTLGIAASIDDLKGDFSKAWNRHLYGLKQYWQGSYAPERAFLFYSELSHVAEDEEQTYAATVLAREAVLTIVPAKKQNVEALARYRWASLAEVSGAEVEAQEQFVAADQMFSEIERNAPKDKPKTTLPAYQTAGRVMLANLEARRGKLEESLVLLEEASPGLSAVENDTVLLQFYSTLGEVHLKRGERDAAVLGEVHLKRSERDAAMKALRSAMSIGEIGARTMKGDHDRLVWDRQVGNAYRDMVRLLLLNDSKAEEALNLWEWYRALPLRAGQAPNSMRSGHPVEIDFAKLENDPVLPVPQLLTGLQPQLKNVTVLSYVQMPDGIAIWVFDDRGITSEWVALNQEEADRVISRFNRECSDPESDVSTLKRDAYQLYQWLIAPVASQFDSSRDLVVEADGTISTLAFEALVDDGGAYLGSRFAITASLGTEYMKGLRHDDLITPDLPALVVGTPALRGEIAGEFLPIPDARREAETIAGRFFKAEPLIGIQATATAVRKSLPRAAVFHFAGHALAGEERAGLLLASEEADNNSPTAISLLNASTLNPSLAAHTRLVVLSACSTASVNVSRTADPDNLVRVFLRGGVPHIVASRWDVDSRITDRLMEAFYSQLFSGETVAHALRHVRTDMLATKETMHPYYWAAFAAFGRS